MRVNVVMAHTAMQLHVTELMGCCARCMLPVHMLAGAAGVRTQAAHTCCRPATKIGLACHPRGAGCNTQLHPQVEGAIVPMCPCTWASSEHGLIARQALAPA